MRGKILSIGVLALLALIILPHTVGSVCGNADNLSNSMDVRDIIYLINYEFKAGPPPYRMSDADFNGDGQVNILDMVRMILSKFKCPDGKCMSIPPLCPPYTNTEINSGCLQGKDEGEDYMTVEVVGNDLHIYHSDAFYQCCLVYEVDYLFPAGKITAFEYDRGDLCDCYCPFNLESILDDVASGTYEVMLIGIEGDTVGVETVVVP